MEITRRGMIAGLAALSAALTASDEDQHADSTIMGPTVFNWNDMTPKKTATGEVRSL